MVYSRIFQASPVKGPPEKELIYKYYNRGQAARKNVGWGKPNTCFFYCIHGNTIPITTGPGARCGFNSRKYRLEPSCTLCTGDHKNVKWGRQFLVLNKKPAFLTFNTTPFLARMSLLTMINYLKTGLFFDKSLAHTNAIVRRKWWSYGRHNSL
jgi:hypothetical protein